LRDYRVLDEVLEDATNLFQLVPAFKTSVTAVLVRVAGDKDRT
jgi:hypothetical protein